MVLVNKNNFAPISSLISHIGQPPQEKKDGGGGGGSSYSPEQPLPITRNSFFYQAVFMPSEKRLFQPHKLLKDRQQSSRCGSRFMKFLKN